MPIKEPPIVLSIAGHDPSGGAGIQADIETISSLGCHPATALTCLTIQDSCNVKQLIPIDPGVTRSQAETVLADYPVGAIKIGLIGNSDMVDMLTALLSQHRQIPVILDPVLAAGGGTELAGRMLTEKIAVELLPHITLATPNRAEARRLSGETEQRKCADKLLRSGCQSLLITGADEASSEVTNSLYRQDSPSMDMAWPLLEGSYHGSGCTLASAIAAFLARGEELSKAVSLGQRFTWTALSHGWRPGKGQLLPRRNWESDLSNLDN